MTAPSEFIFLNQLGRLEDVNWNGPERELLWRYNQHYFHDLNAFGHPSRLDWHISLIKNWILHNPPGFGVGWDSYPISLRIVNWIKWSLQGGPLAETAVHSLACQVRWLSKRIEYHLLGNHLLANAKALVVSGLFFTGEESNEWFEVGMEILTRELNEQILPDGGHIERSPMYQALVLEDLLDLINMSQCFSAKLNEKNQLRVGEWIRLVRLMLRWMMTMTHPDGEISFFNDSAIGVAPTPSNLEAYAKRVLPRIEMIKGAPSTVLADSGYIRLMQNQAVLILDVAPVGPDYLPAHAHADTLSFELSIGKTRLLVNSGTSCYRESQERSRQRGTAAHNTVLVNGENSSETWGSFRVARRAYPIGLCTTNTVDESVIEVVCAHDGYRRLRGKPIHKRIWQFGEDLVIEDSVSSGEHDAEARFHFHPDVRVVHEPVNGSFVVSLLDSTVAVLFVERGDATLEGSTWHPEFGVSIENTCLVISLVDRESKLRVKWMCDS